MVPLIFTREPLNNDSIRTGQMTLVMAEAVCSIRLDFILLLVIFVVFSVDTVLFLILLAYLSNGY
jgi:hypothetical protein